MAWLGTPRHPHLGRIWGFFFIYPAVMAVLIQFVVLPYVFPAWHAGGGILIQGDSAYWHLAAVDLAHQIHEQGWSVWELKPFNIPPIGFASAIYALTTPALWTLIPLNAALHAAAALLLVQIMRTLLHDWREAFLVSLPFWVYPSAMNWYTQLHKDGFAIAGAFFVLYGWVLFSQFIIWRQSYWRLSFAFVCISVGAGLVWIVRPYMLQMMLGVSVPLWLVLVLFFGIRCNNLKTSWPIILLTVAIILVVIISFYYVLMNVEQLSPNLRDLKQQSSDLSIVEQLSFVREYFINDVRGLSALDAEVRFSSSKDIINYLPRAFQIAFLSPFPSMWFGQGILPQTTFMRRVVAFEMIGVYLSLFWLPITAWRWRSTPQFWIILIFSTGFMLIYSLVVTNIGTLYRYRHGFMMVIVALGLAGGLSVWKRARSNSSN